MVEGGGSEEGPKQEPDEKNEAMLSSLSNDFEFSTSVFGQLTGELQKILKVGDNSSKFECSYSRGQSTFGSEYIIIDRR